MSLSSKQDGTSSEWQRGAGLWGGWWSYPPARLRGWAGTRFLVQGGVLRCLVGQGQGTPPYINITGSLGVAVNTCGVHSVWGLPPHFSG